MSGSQFNNLPPEITKIFDDILKYRIDPSGKYYGRTLDQLVTDITMLNTNAVHAIESEGKENFNPILKSFVQGSGGQLTTWDRTLDSQIPVVVRGVTKRKIMEACKKQGRDFYYIDTGYFGNHSTKGKLYHRIAFNDVQYFGPIVDRPRDRLIQTGFQPRKFCRGKNILLAPPSQKLLTMYNIDLKAWLNTTINTIKQHTDRPIVIREKQSRTIRQTENTIEMALDCDVHCLVTYSSIAAGEALLYGKPAFTLGPNAAAPLCKQNLAEIEDPYIPTLDEVESWAANLAYHQFTVDEMLNGTAWQILNND